MSDHELTPDEIRELRALLAVPAIKQQVDAHREYLASLEVASRTAEETMRRREAEAAQMRSRVERDPLVVVSVAPNALDAGGKPVKRVWTRAGFDVAVKGDKFKDGIAIDGFGTPTPSQHRMLHSQWLKLLAGDKELRAAVEAGHLQIDTVDVDHVARALANGSYEYQRFYR